jgi:hypothetical protein
MTDREHDSPVSFFRDASGKVHLHGKVHPRVVRVVFPSSKQGARTATPKRRKRA